VSEGTKCNYCKEKAKRAYAYLKECGLVGRGLFEKPDRLTALSTFFIFLATAVAAGVGMAQWHALSNTDEKLGRQVEAMNRQLALLQIDQRPWISAPEIKVERGDMPDTVTFILVFRNAGRTPTTGFDIEVDIVNGDEWRSVLLHFCTNRRLTMKEPDNIKHYREFSVVPQSIIALQRPRLENIEISRLRGRESKTPHVIGCFLYGSQFDDIVHQTGFSAQIVVKGQDVTVPFPLAVEPN
jgi:hypothetical protein